MKIIALPDLHAQTGSLEAIGACLSSVDLILLVGDLTNGGGVMETGVVVATVRKFNSNILAVPGNWDHPEVSAYLTEERINLNGRCQIFDQFALIGAGGSLPGLISTPNEVNESDLERCLNLANAGCEPGRLVILVSHQPPIDTITDLAQGKTHIGSMAVRQFIERVQPLICFTGHIHESVGIDRIGSTRIINPGPLWQGKYAFAELNNGELKTLEIQLIPGFKPK